MPWARYAGGWGLRRSEGPNTGRPTRTTEQEPAPRQRTDAGLVRSDEPLVGSHGLEPWTR